MTELEISVAGSGYEELEAYLESDRAPLDGMLISELDGFLTGLAVGPELIMPSEWLPVVWDGEEPVFADEREAQAVMGGILSRYNEILRQVEDGTVQPLVWEDTDGTVIPFDWAEGFALAIGLRPEAWDPLFKSKKHGFLLFPILALCGDEEGESAFGLDAEAEDEIMAAAPQMIPASVAGIAAFWKRRRARGSGLRVDRLPAAPLAPKIGRNTMCPCGSGKKFKRCCGRSD